MTDPQTIPLAPAPGPAPAPHRAPRRRAIALIAGLVALALVATLVFVLVRSRSGLAGEDTSAGELQDWGEPDHVETFDGPLGPQWQLYDSEGHGGNGIRTPDAITTEDGVLRITGDPAGATGGVAWDVGQKYGRWEGRVRAPASDETYNALLILWPEINDWPQGGEIDFMEMTDPSRQRTKIFVHYVEEELKDSTEDLKDQGRKIEGEVRGDGTEWHNWAVEWTPEHIVAYLDGQEWFRTTDREVQPPRPMNLTIQLDWFPEQENPADTEDGIQQSTMEVDWVKQYSYPGP